MKFEESIDIDFLGPVDSKTLDNSKMLLVCFSR